MKNKKSFKLLSFLLCVALFLAYIPNNTISASTTTSFAGGNGTKTDPYLIKTKEQLDNVRNNLDAHYKLITDIEFTKADFTKGGDFYNNSEGWEPIGTNDFMFTGTFDGNNHTITGLTITATVPQNLSQQFGLFGYVYNGTIKNLKMYSTDINIFNKGAVDVGGIVGSLHQGSIDNCYIQGKIFVKTDIYSCSTYAGGIVGEAWDSSIVNVQNTAHITTTGDDRVGGICGSTNAYIKNATNYGNISGTTMVAGIIASFFGEALTRCTNHGKIESVFHDDIDYNGAYAGGIAAYFAAYEITLCANFGEVYSYCEKSYGSSAAGIAAYANGMITKCYNSGEIFADGGTGAVAGGICATLYFSRIQNCYNTEKISAVSNAGGIVGFVQDSNVVNCHNIGTIDAETSGGIVGESVYDSFFSNCYYSDNISFGAGTGTTIDLSYQLTHEAMKSPDSFSNWDFEKIWTIDAYSDYKYPILQDFILKLGDANSDGDINNRDLGILIQCINGWNVQINTDCADVNADAKINNKDYALLMRYINGWNVELK